MVLGDGRGGEGGDLREGGEGREGEWRTFLAAVTGHRDHYCTITTIIIIVIANYPIIVTNYYYCH